MKLFVEIPADLSLEVERRYFEYMVAQNVVAYLMQKRNIDKDILQSYIDTVECRGVELELMKRTISKEYCPDTLCDEYLYSFDFDNHTLVFEEM